MKKPKRETAEQRARRIGRGMGFYLRPSDDRHDGFVRVLIHREQHVDCIDSPTSYEIALWRALERSQRALARARGVRL